MQSNGSVVIGEVNPGFISPPTANGFMRISPSGTVDSAFNAGGSGFLNMNPGSIRTLAAQADNKILIGGKFETVGGISRPRLARLNADTTLDNTFQLTFGGSGDRFTQISDVYNVRIQPEGKLVVTGSFDYFVNNVLKKNIVRLNANGSIDSSFAPAVSAPFAGAAPKINPSRLTTTATAEPMSPSGDRRTELSTGCRAWRATNSARCNSAPAATFRRSAISTATGKPISSSSVRRKATGIST